MKSKTTYLLASGFVLLWNSGFIGAEFGLPYTGPFTLLLWRYLALTLVMFFYLLVTKRFNWVGWKTAAPNMLVGALAHGVWLLCVLVALDNGVPAGIVALIVALQPLTTGALSGSIAGEHTSLSQWMGLLIGFIGVAFTVSFHIDFESSLSIFSYLIPLGSVIAITLANLIQRRMELRNEKSKLPVDLSLFYQSLATVMVLVLPAIFVEQLATRWEQVFIYTMVWLTIAVSLGAYAFMWLLIKRTEATRVASLFYLGPPVTMMMAWLAFGDQIKTTDIVGLTLVFIGVLLTQLKTNRKLA